MKKRLFITGASGYLGGRIINYFEKINDYELTLATSSNLKNLSYLSNRHKIVNLNLFNKFELLELLKNSYAILHLASLNEIECAKSINNAININVIGTYNLLEAAIENNIKKFIYFSTAHIYGSPLIGEINEKTLPKPTHPYAISNLAAEYFVYSANKNKSISGSIFRLSNCFGAPIRQNINRWTLVVNDICLQVIKTRKIILKTNGDQKRDFITIEDVCRAVNHLILLEDTNDGVFNLGGNLTLSILEIAKLIAERAYVLFGFTPNIELPNNNVTNVSENLNYNSNKFFNTGFQLKSNINYEIDNTLKICKEWYNKI